MKYLTILLFPLIFGCARETPKPPQIYMPDPTLSKDVREVTSDSIVFLGDSLTHIAVWRDMFPNIKTSNQGVGGNTTIMVLNRLQAIIDAKPKKIFLLIGANDLNFGTPVEGITLGQNEIIKRIVEGTPNTELYVQSIFPFGKDVRLYFPFVPKSYKDDIENLNTALIILCLNYKNQGAKITYLDVYRRVMVDMDRNMKPEYTADQLHLEKPGYDAWAKFLEPYLMP